MAWHDVLLNGVSAIIGGLIPPFILFLLKERVKSFFQRGVLKYQIEKSEVHKYRTNKISDFLGKAYELRAFIRTSFSNISCIEDFQYTNFRFSEKYESAEYALNSASIFLKPEEEMTCQAFLDESVKIMEEARAFVRNKENFEEETSSIHDRYAFLESQNKLKERVQRFPSHLNDLKNSIRRSLDIEE